MDHNNLVLELLAYSNPEQAVELAKTNQALQKVVSKVLGEKNQWYFADFRGFLEVYYTHILTFKAVKYLSPQSCFQWSLREANLKLAEKFFQHRVLVDPAYLDSMSSSAYGDYSYACLSRQENVVEWLIKLYESHFKRLPRLAFQDIYYAICSGSISILKRILSLTENSVVYLDPDRLIYYICLSNSLEMFEFVTSSFDLRQKEIVINKVNYLDSIKTIIENNLDWGKNSVGISTPGFAWGRIYSCALNTKADAILKLVTTRVGIVEYQGLFDDEELPINPVVYDRYPKLVLEKLNDETELAEFFDLVEWDYGRRKFPDRYLTLKKLDSLIRNSKDQQTANLRKKVIDYALLGGHVNIANFFRKMGYPIKTPYGGAEDNPFDLIAEDPVGQYWYRSLFLLKPRRSWQFKRYLVSYHQIDDNLDPFVPSGVSMEWIVDRLLDLKNIDQLELHLISDDLQNDIRFNPNYRLMELVSLIDRFGENRRVQLLEKLFWDPRVNHRAPALQKIAGDITVGFSRQTMMDFHLQRNLSKKDRLKQIVHLSVGLHNELIKYPVSINKFKIYYLLSNEDLAKLLNDHQVPWIPYLNSLVAALLLAGYDGKDTIFSSDVYQAQRIAPISTHQRIANVTIMMNAKKSLSS